MGEAGSGCGRESDRPGGDDEEIRGGVGVVFQRGVIRADGFEVGGLGSGGISEAA